MIIVAWIILALFVGFLVMLVCPDWTFGFLVVGLFLGSALVVWAGFYVQQAKSAINE